MFEGPPCYRSYLLTLWQERGRDPGLRGVWRFRLEDARTAKRVGFASLDDLVAYLQQQTGAVPCRDGGEGLERR
jgi:hypothetical protein